MRLFDSQPDHTAGFILEVACTPHELDVSVNLEPREGCVANGEEEPCRAHVPLAVREEAQEDGHSANIWPRANISEVQRIS